MHNGTTNLKVNASLALIGSFVLSIPFFNHIHHKKIAQMNYEIRSLNAQIDGINLQLNTEASILEDIRNTKWSANDAIKKLRDQLYIRNVYLQNFFASDQNEGINELDVKVIQNDNDHTTHTFNRVHEQLLIVDTGSSLSLSLLVNLPKDSRKKVDSLDMYVVDTQDLEMYSFEGKESFQTLDDLSLKVAGWSVFSTNDHRKIAPEDSILFLTFSNLGQTAITIWESLGDDFISFKRMINIIHEEGYTTDMSIKNVYVSKDKQYAIHVHTSGGDGDDTWGTHWLATLNEDYELDFIFSQGYGGSDEEGYFSYESRLDKASNKIIMTKKFLQWDENSKIDSLIWEKPFSFETKETKYPPTISILHLL